MRPYSAVQRYSRGGQSRKRCDDGERQQRRGFAKHLVSREDRGNPALILLHGGPGASESALFRHYNAELEKYFLAVYWEQRGTGRSYHSDLAPESMTIEQFLRDLDEVVELVKRRFHKDKVVLLGHSWGTALGTIYSFRHPKKLAPTSA